MTEQNVIVRWRENKFEYTADATSVVRMMKVQSGEENLTNEQYMKEVARRSMIVGIHLLFADEITFLEALNEANMSNIEVISNEKN